MESILSTEATQASAIVVPQSPLASSSSSSTSSVANPGSEDTEFASGVAGSEPNGSQPFLDFFWGPCGRTVPNYVLQKFRWEYCRRKPIDGAKFPPDWLPALSKGWPSHARLSATVYDPTSNQTREIKGYDVIDSNIPIVYARHHLQMGKATSRNFHNLSKRILERFTNCFTVHPHRFLPNPHNEFLDQESGDWFDYEDNRARFAAKFTRRLVETCWLTVELHDSKWILTMGGSFIGPDRETVTVTGDKLTVSFDIKNASDVLAFLAHDEFNWDDWSHTYPFMQELAAIDGIVASVVASSAGADQESNSGSGSSCHSQFEEDTQDSCPPSSVSSTSGQSLCDFSDLIFPGDDLEVMIGSSKGTTWFDY